MPSIISTKTSGAGGIAVTGDASGVLQLQSANGTTAVTIDANQNVGIGTASPNFNASTGTVCHINNASAGAWTVNHYTNGTTGAGVTDGLLVGNIGAAAYVWNYENSTIEFGTNAAARMTISGSGNVTVNTATAYGVFTSSANANWAAAFVREAGDARGTVRFINGTTEVGSISTFPTATVYGTTSDYRLKENIAPMTGALEIVSKLNPVTYKWKVNGSNGQGFIAHELQEIMPDCVIGEKDAVDEQENPIYQNIDTSFLVATLTAAIQEQQSIIEDLKTRIEVLEGASA